ncbi:MAG: hemerythrin domain-containing protein [Betaproteobacteria bacterium]|nr:hemerythrin domain-containing protein [Betaproteobacteria bacterium]MDH3435552.1 hemerythrin domain-containing protein [Betaproteobacteria bacterium]
MTSAFDPTLDFTRPLELLRVGHQRIQRECDALRHLISNLKERGCDSAAREISARVVRKLDAVTYHHKEDEEQDLLPRMMAAATRGRGSALTRMVTDIGTEHQVLQRAWTELRADLQELAAGDRKSLNVLAVDRFVKLYRTHILMEEAAVYPLAEMLLSNEDLTAMGTQMAHRRSVSPD